MKKKQIIILISILAIAILFILGNVKQQAITTSKFDKATYIIKEQDVNSVIIKFIATSESDVTTPGCNEDESFPLPTTFYAENFQHLIQPDKNLELLNSLDENYYPIISYKVNDEVSSEISCIGHPESFKVNLNFISGECKVITIQDKLALDCKEIKASLVPTQPSNLRNLNRIEIEVKIPKKTTSQQIKEDIAVSPDLELLPSTTEDDTSISSGGYYSPPEQNNQKESESQKIFPNIINKPISEIPLTTLLKEKIGIDIGLFIGLIFIIILILILVVIIIRRL